MHDCTDKTDCSKHRALCTGCKTQMPYIRHTFVDEKHHINTIYLRFNWLKRSSGGICKLKLNLWSLIFQLSAIVVCGDMCFVWFRTSRQIFQWANGRARSSVLWFRYNIRLSVLGLSDSVEEQVCWKAENYCSTRLQARAELADLVREQSIGFRYNRFSLFGIEWWQHVCVNMEIFSRNFFIMCLIYFILVKLLIYFVQWFTTSWTYFPVTNTPLGKLMPSHSREINGVCETIRPSKSSE